MALGAPARSALGVPLRSALGVRDKGGPPTPAPLDKGFIEFISENNGGTYRGWLRLHGFQDNTTILWDLDSLQSFLADRTTRLHGVRATFDYDASATVTICNGTKVVDTPNGSTQMRIDSVAVVAAPPDVLRIKAALPADQSQSQEHWTNLAQCTSTATHRYYDQADQCLWGYTRLQRSQQAPNTQLLECDGVGTWQTALGDIENIWAKNGTIDVPIELEPAFLERWDGTDTKDFSLLVTCATRARYAPHEGGKGRMAGAAWEHWDRGGPIHADAFPDFEWIAIPVLQPFLWPGF